MVNRSDVEAAAGRHIGKCAVVIVPIERGQGAPAARRPILTVDQQDVGPAIAVVIEKQPSRSHGLDEMVFRALPVGVLEPDAGVLGDVHELRRRVVGRE